MTDRNPSIPDPIRSKPVPTIGLYLRRADGKGTVTVGVYETMAQADAQMKLTIRDPSVTMCWILGPLGSCLRDYVRGQS